MAMLREEWPCAAGAFHVKHRWVTDRGLWLESGEGTLALMRVLEDAAFKEVEALVPGDNNLLVVMKPGLAPGEGLMNILDHMPFSSGREDSGQTHEIPVAYGGESGPDLQAVAEAAGITVRQAIELHAGAEYRVLFLGFQPGFAYLEGTPKDLHAERKATPRLRIPAGSVALGSGYTGIYPGESPGGWHLIGRTGEWLFDPSRCPPARFAPGDRVRFVPK
jgi:KipI family sensor histidine kinase inhibitor